MTWLTIVPTSPYRDRYFPSAETYVEYLEGYSRRHHLNIVTGYDALVDCANTSAQGQCIQYRVTGSPSCCPSDEEGCSTEGRFSQTWDCKTVVIAVGLDVMNTPKGMPSDPEVETYRDGDIQDPESFRNQSVLILGNGNSGAEVATVASKLAQYVHVFARRPVRLSFLTHYVGDLRALNAQPLDTYQLKSLDGFVEVDQAVDDATNPLGHFHVRRTATGRLKVTVSGSSGSNFPENFPLRGEYDRVINCLGFRMNTSVFGPSIAKAAALEWKYPQTTPFYEAGHPKLSGLYYAGTLMHGRDFRRSAGGFVHGFRYLVRAMVRRLKETHFDGVWPGGHHVLDAGGLRTKIEERLDTSAGLYQMFSVLTDVFAIPTHSPSNDPESDEAGEEWAIEYFEEFPFQGLPDRFHPSDYSLVMTMSLEYGDGFTGCDVLGADRAASDPEEADEGGFLHPVFRRWAPGAFSKPLATKHLLEDFQTEYASDRCSGPFDSVLEVYGLSSATLLTITYLSSSLSLFSSRWTLPNVHKWQLNEFLLQERPGYA